MPYLKFEDMSGLKFRNENLEKLMKEEDDNFVAFINDPNYGVVVFLSDSFYRRLDNSNLRYKTLPKENITAPYAILLREKYPDKDL